MLALYSIPENDVHFAGYLSGVAPRTVSRGPSDTSPSGGQNVSPVGFDAVAEKCHSGCRMSA